MVSKKCIEWFRLEKSWANYFGKDFSKKSYSIVYNSKFDDFSKFLNKKEKDKVNDFVNRTTKLGYEFRRLSLILEKINNTWQPKNVMIQFGEIFYRAYGKYERLYLEVN